MKTTKKLVISTAIKTLVLLVLIAILFTVAYSLAKPKEAGDFFYTVGLKGISARSSLRAAQESGNIEDYYNTLVRAYDANSYKIAAYAATAILSNDKSDSLFTSKQYSDFATNMDTKLSRYKGATNQYIKMVFAYAQMRVNKGCDENGVLWNKIREYCKGTGIYYYYNSVCPVTGYINGVIDSKKTDDATVYRILLQMKEMDEGETTTGYPYWRATKDNTMESSSDNFFDAQVYMVYDIGRLIDAKDITLQKVQDYASSLTDGAKYVEAFNYWNFMISAQAN